VRLPANGNEKEYDRDYYNRDYNLPEFGGWMELGGTLTSADER
jgi:hypothetical protein